MKIVVNAIMKIVLNALIANILFNMIYKNVDSIVKLVFLNYIVKKKSILR